MKTFYYNASAPKVRKLFDLKSTENRNLYCNNEILGFDNINYSKKSKKYYFLYKTLENVDVYIDEYGMIYSSDNYNYGMVDINNQICFANVILAGERKVYISDGKNSKVFSPTAPNYISSAKAGTTACHHKGRLYVYVGNGKIVGSAPFDVANFDADKTIDFMTEDVYGPVFALLESDNFVYAVCKWGVFRFVEKSSRNISVESVAKFNVSIREETVAGVGQSIYFATQDAIVKVDGTNVEIVKSDLFNRGYSVEYLKAIGQNGRYYIRGKFNGEWLTYSFKDGKQENLCLDKNFSILPSLLVSENPAELVVGYWKKVILDEDVKRKSLMKISCTALKPCVLSISTKGQVKKFNVVEGKNVLNVNMTGSSFTVEIQTPVYQQKISDVELVYYDKEM